MQTKTFSGCRPLHAGRLALLLLLACCQLFLAGSAASATEEAEPYMGYFEYPISLVDRSTGKNVELIRIPNLTPLLIEPVSQEKDKNYGQTSYGGKTGLVYLKDIKHIRADNPDPKEGQQLYALDVRMLREWPIHGAQILKRLPPETLFTVLANNKSMLKVEVNGLTGYIYQNDLHQLRPDTPVGSGLMYSAREQPLLSYPLQGGSILKNLRQGELVTLLAANKQFFRVRAGQTEGYVAKAGLAQIGQLADDVMLVYADKELPLYTEPGISFPAGQSLPDEQLAQVMGQAGDFLQLKDSGLFVEASKVQALVLKAFKTPRQGFVSQALAISLRPEGVKADQVLEPLQLYTFTAQAGSWWFMNEGQLSGFVPASAVQALPERGLPMNRTWAVLQGQGEEAANPQVIQLMALYGNQWFKDQLGNFIHSSKLRIIGSDAPLTPHVVQATQGLSLISLPDSKLGQVIRELVPGEPLQVQGFCRSYLLVRAGEQEGYVPGSTLKTYETRYLSDSEDMPAVGILVNKADFTVSLFAVDEQGHRLSLALRSELAALGKRSTPTSSGRFLLGLKQRWVQFSRTAAPHGITFQRGRYIHGIPCETKNENTATDWGLAEIGSFATGGCVRLPFDMAAYLYFSCPSYTTFMEVINGQ